MGKKTAFVSGDVVDVFFANGERVVGAVVVHVPSEVGDHWRIETNGRLVSLNPMGSNLESIVLVKAFVDPLFGPATTSSFPESPSEEAIAERTARKEPL